MSCSVTLRVMFDGMAKPMPMLPPVGEKICELMPTSSPVVLTSAPPELPWLMGASVCRKSSKLPSERPVRRPLAEMMPAVTVWPTPKGFPTASTTSPTRTRSESPSVSTGRSFASTLRTARSDGGSLPTSLAGKVRRSANSTVICSAPSTTWWLVTM
jgi:hypothetical protein